MQAARRTLTALVVAGTLALALTGASSSSSSTYYNLRVGDGLDVGGLFFGCSYSRQLGRRAFACSDDGDPKRALGVVVFRDRIVVMRGDTVIYRAFR